MSKPLSKKHSNNLFILVLQPLLIFVCFTSFAQSEIYKNYTVKDGLPSNTVYKAFQDSKGFIWFSTDAGVSRFDGSRFENFTMDDGLSDNEVFQIKEDSKGRIWFLTFNGNISYFFNEKIYNKDNDTLIKKIKSNGYLFSIFEDREHNIWLGRSSKYISQIRHDGAIVEYELPKIIGTPHIEPYFYENGKIKCITRLRIMDIATNKNFLSTDKINSRLIYNFAPCYYSSNEIYFYSDFGIERILNGIREIIIPANRISNLKDILSISVSKERDIWLTTLTDQTVLYKKGIDGKYILEQKFLKGKQVIYVFNDRENNTWFCTRGDGVYLNSYNYQGTITYTKGNGLSENQVNCVYLDIDNKLWIGYNNGKISCFDGNNFIEYNLSFFNRSTNRIIQILNDASGNILVANDEGISALIKDKSGYSKPLFLGVAHYSFNNNVYYAKAINLAKDGRINYLIAGSYGFIKRKGKTFQCVPQKVLESGKRCFTSFVDSENNFWISNNEGLVKFDGNIETNFLIMDGWLKGRLSQIGELADGNLLLASYGFGIGLFNGTKIIKTITINDGLPSNTCNRFILQNNLVYIATNKGISCFKYQKGDFSLISNYNTNEGLISDKVNYLAVDENKIYAATPEGLSILPIKNEVSKSKDLHTTIKYFSVNGEKENLLSNIVVDYSKNHLQVHFKAPVFQHAEFVSYQFKVDGRDNTWNETKNDFVEFYGLPPGEYTFKVRAKYQDALSKNVTSLYFVITPPIWKTTWFRFLSFILFLATSYFIIKLIAKRRSERQLLIFEKERVLVDERTRIANEMHDDVGADLSNLLLKIRMNEQQQTTVTAADLSGLKKTTNTIIHKIDEIIWSLNSERDTLNELVNFISKYYETILKENQLNGELKLAENFPSIPLAAKLRRNIFLIVKEILNNTLKHAAATKIDLEMFCIDNTLRIKISDNGVGFETEQSYHGNGLKNIQKRSDESRGTLSIQSNKENGTSIEIKITLQ